MKKITLITLICIILVSTIGFGEELKKDEIARKIAMLRVQEKRMADFFNPKLERDSLDEIKEKMMADYFSHKPEGYGLGVIEWRLNKVLYTKYSIEPVLDSQIEGVRVYDLSDVEFQMDSTSIYTSHPQHFVVAITDDLRSFRLQGFERQTEFNKMIAHLAESGISLDKNIVPLSELFYCLEREIPNRIIVSNDRELKKALETWDIEDLGGALVDSIASRIEPASSVKRIDTWTVVFFAVE